MRFWDASAVVPLIVEEPMSEDLRTLLEGDRGISVWWATWAECVSALSRRLREGDIEPPAGERSRAKLKVLSGEWIEIQPTTRLRSLAGRLLAVHPLRTADALQLAAALRWCQGEPDGREFVSLDDRLREAAKKEGFSVMPEVAAAS